MTTCTSSANLSAVSTLGTSAFRPCMMLISDTPPSSAMMIFSQGAKMSSLGIRELGSRVTVVLTGIVDLLFGVGGVHCHRKQAAVEKLAQSIPLSRLFLPRCAPGCPSVEQSRS